MAEDSWFGGQHGPEGAWKSLKGPMLAPHELPYDVQDQNMGDARFNGQVKGPMPWTASLKPHEGMTMGTDKNMPR